MSIKPLKDWKSVDEALAAAQTCISHDCGGMELNGRRQRAFMDYAEGKAEYHSLESQGSLKGYLRLIPQGEEAYIDHLAPLTEEHVMAAKEWAKEQPFAHVYLNARHPEAHYTLPDEEVLIIPIDLQDRPRVTSDTPANGKHYVCFDLKD